MRLVNRQAAIVYLRQPFVDWINMTEKHTGGTTSFTLEEVNREPHVYLLNSYDTTEENVDHLQEFRTMILEAELGGWYTDADLWPDKLPDEVFDRWLKVDLHSVVVDLEGGRLKKGERFP